MDSLLSPPADPHIQAFSILDERVCNVEQGVDLLTHSLKWMEMRNMGTLNNKLLGYKFSILNGALPGQQLQDPILEAAVLEMVLLCVGSGTCQVRGSSVRNATAELGKSLDVEGAEKFSHQFLLAEVDGDPAYGMIAYGMIAEGDQRLTLCEYIDGVLQMSRHYGHTPACVHAIHVHPCGVCDLVMFAAGVRLKKSGAGEDTDDGESDVEMLACHYNLRTNPFFRMRLQGRPKFRSLLSAQPP